MYIYMYASIMHAKSVTTGKGHVLIWWHYCNTTDPASAVLPATAKLVYKA